MRVLLLVSAFNGLSQRVWCALRQAGHDVGVLLATSPQAVIDGVAAAPMQQGKEVYRRSNAPIVPRAKADVLRLFDGYDLLDPGLVWLGDWRPDDGDQQVSHGYGGVGVKP